MPRKHLIASATNKKQQANAVLLQKLAKEIKAAVKQGGNNPENNSRLKVAIKKALENNLSRESIDKNLNPSKDDNLIEEMNFEGFGPDGSMFYIQAISDNVNRTASAIRGYFSKMNSSLSKQGSVSAFFISKSAFIFNNDQYNEDKILEVIADYEILDINNDNDSVVLIFSDENYYSVFNSLKSNGFEFSDSYIFSEFFDYIEVDNKKTLDTIKKFLSQCEEDFDIQKVEHNLSNTL
jgi:YebC/PmpR family DNA-binding regulatory protein